MNAHSEEEADGQGRNGASVTRRAVIGGVVGAGLLEVMSIACPGHNGAMADDLPGGPNAHPGAGDAAPFTADAPRVYTRAQWQARPPRRTARVINRRPDRIVVHHTATPNAKDRSLAHAFALSRYIQDFHMNKNGWDDTGQQLTISRGGIVMEGRNRSLQAVETGALAVGAQVLHHNEHTIGIENEGTYMKKGVPQDLWTSLVEVCVWLCKAYSLDPADAIVGHRDYNNTSCPGDVLYARLPELRRVVAERLSMSPSPGNGVEASGPILPILPRLDGLH
ncbi:N-acetylmuramoyl-L-alanine amidase [Actinomadura pelletieri DSM 43383]|uniref:N-acetylmuramoyl-L-alanine amidase n=2 Tax=Actinomadura pelletieri TaxID=111805 RepID=A0A495QYP0_9ACTN|nr:N-acetylmuramoyl-L-alanine amidase [Actinomadura pelletieri DSM 43383]